MEKNMLFLLSEAEVEKYLLSEQKRKCKFKNHYGCWWLRSSGWNHDTKKALVVAALIGACSIQSNKGLVRPAMYINPDYLKNNKPNRKGYIDFAGRKWIVLDTSTGLLLSKDALCSYCFDRKTSDYMPSEIRGYLNDKLVNEFFTDEERNMIVNAVIDGETSYPEN